MSKLGQEILGRLAIAILVVVAVVFLGWILPELQGPTIDGKWLGGANPLFMRYLPSRAVTSRCTDNDRRSFPFDLRFYILIHNQYFSPSVVTSIFPLHRFDKSQHLDHLAFL